MQFQEPGQLWWLLAVAAFGLFAARREQARRRLLAMFAEAPMLARLASDYSPGRARIGIVLLVGALASLVVALAGPQWGTRMVTVQRQGIDVVLAVDCSASMNAEDVKPSRLQVARRELGELVKQLEGNRLGLVGFAGTAFPFCPLTLDISATHLFLEQLSENVMPVPGTALGDAIRTASGLFPTDDANKKVIILLTDGEDHHSNPLEAAKEAAKAGITVHTVGIGSTAGQPIPEREGPRGETYVHDDAGRMVMSRLDEATLKEIARLTGGLYTRVGDTGTDALAPVVTAINGAEKGRLSETLQQRHLERFQVFIAAALALLALERMNATRRRRGALRSRGVVA